MMDDPLDNRNLPCDYRMKLNVAFERVSVSALTDQAKKRLGDLLNGLTIRPTDSDLVRDYRGLAHLMGFGYDIVQQLEEVDDKIGQLLEQWQVQQGSTIGRLIDFLTELERFDAIEDLEINLRTCVRHYHAQLAELDVTEAQIPPPQVPGVRFVSRKEWEALRPMEVSSLEVGRVRVVFIHHTVWAGATDLDTVRNMQSVKIIFYGHWDLPYNFMVGRDGTIFEGRGWGRCGSHTACYNSLTISIALLGNYEETEPPDAMFRSIESLIEYGVSLNQIHSNYGVYAHCDASVTQSPGKYTVKKLPSLSRYHHLGPLPSPQQLRDLEQ